MMKTETAMHHNLRTPTSSRSMCWYIPMSSRSYGDGSRSLKRIVTNDDELLVERHIDSWPMISTSYLQIVPVYVWTMRTTTMRTQMQRQTRYWTWQQSRRRCPNPLRTLPRRRRHLRSLDLIATRILLWCLSGLDSTSDPVSHPLCLQWPSPS